MVPYKSHKGQKENAIGDNYLGDLSQRSRKHRGVARPASPSPTRPASEQLVIPSLNNDEFSGNEDCQSPLPKHSRPTHGRQPKKVVEPPCDCDNCRQETNGFRSVANESETDDDTWNRKHSRPQKNKRAYQSVKDQHYTEEDDYAQKQHTSPLQTKRSDRNPCDIPDCVECIEAEVSVPSTQRGPSTAKDNDNFWSLESDGEVYNATHSRNTRRKYSSATRNSDMRDHYNFTPTPKDDDQETIANNFDINLDDILPPRRRNKKIEDPCTCDDCLDNAERRLTDRSVTPQNETDNDFYISDGPRTSYPRRRRYSRGDSAEWCLCEECESDRADKGLNDKPDDDVYFTEDEDNSGPSNDEDFFVPDADIFETKNYHDLMIALAGCYIKDINVYFNVKEQKLIVWGNQTRNAHLPFATTRVHCTERKIGKFRRTFCFDGERIKKRHIQAEFKDGLLGIILKKKNIGRNAGEKIDITRAAAVSEGNLN